MRDSCHFQNFRKSLDAPISHSASASFSNLATKIPFLFSLEISPNHHTFALFSFSRSAKRSIRDHALHELAIRSHIITEYQEKERRMGKSYANLTAKIVHRPEEKHFSDFLRIENKGPADAQYITISVDSDLKIINMPKEIWHMSVDSSLQYPIIRTAEIRTADSSNELKLDIHWSDDSGEPRQKQMSLNV